MIRDDFCAFILTHGRPDRIYTYDTLKRHGYTGKIYIVIDDEDETESEYKKKFGGSVLQFCKREIAQQIDEGDNFNDRRAIIYARNACWDLAKRVGVKYFIQLDDDYTKFVHTMDSEGEYIAKFALRPSLKNLDVIFDALIEFFIKTSSMTVTMAQGGDFVVGKESSVARKKLARKAMNTFICSTERRFNFIGRVNEDVNTYTLGGLRGELFFTIARLRMEQKPTQSNPGGMTELYIDSGTYIKSFYTVMFAPSCCKVVRMVMATNYKGATTKGATGRLHHRIYWENTVPKIVRENVKKYVK